MEIPTNAKQIIIDAFVLRVQKIANKRHIFVYVIHTLINVYQMIILVYVINTWTNAKKKIIIVVHVIKIQKCVRILFMKILELDN
jgi:nitrate/nitrite-specific signal transduction histidine kinase